MDFYRVQLAVVCLILKTSLEAGTYIDMDYRSSQNVNILTVFQGVLENIATSRLRETFLMEDIKVNSEVGLNRPHETVNFRGNSPSLTCNRLNMGIIGCLPDNVQKSIQSFSIKPGRQHITITFPYMVDLIKDGVDSGRIASTGLTSALYTEFAPEVVSGFQILTTLLMNKKRGRLSVVMLTLFEADSTEGILRHFDSVVRVIIHPKSPITLWKHPISVVDLPSCVLEAIFSSISETVLDIQHENVSRSFPGKTHKELCRYLKETCLMPQFRSYREHLRHTLADLATTCSPQRHGYLMSVVNHMTDPRCTVSDFHTIGNHLMESSHLERCFWMVWSHEQIAPKMFPVARLSYKGGFLFAREQSGTSTLLSMKDGLKAIIDSLKHQEMIETMSERSLLGFFNDTIRCQPQSDRTQHRSAFHRPRVTSQPSTTPYSDALKAVAVSPNRWTPRTIISTIRDDTHRRITRNTVSLTSLNRNFAPTKLNVIHSPKHISSTTPL